MATYVGIDLAKHGLDLAFEPKQKMQHFDHDAEGIQRCRKVLQQIKLDLIVMEPTGGYKVALVVELQAAGLPVAVVNARCIRESGRIGLAPPIYLPWVRAM